MAIRRIGVLTGGGDVPGLNACIKAVTVNGTALGWDVIGIRSGYRGLLDYDLSDPLADAKHLIPLTPSNVRTIDRMGGTILHTTRTSPDKLSASELPTQLKGQVQPGVDGRFDCTAQVLRTLEALRVVGYLGGFTLETDYRSLGMDRVSADIAALDTLVPA